MKKFIILCLIFPCITVRCSELTEDYLDIAANYCTYGKYQDALIYLNKIIEAEPSNNEVKNLKQTIVRVMNPNEQSYLTSTNQNIHKFAQYKKEGDTARQISALNSNPGDFWSNYILAQYYRQNNEFKNALFYYRKAININPNYSQTYLGLSQTCACLNDYQNTIKFLNKYLSYNPNSDIAYALRARANMETGNIEQAQKDIEHAISIEENIAYFLTEAKILYGKKNYKEAKEKLNLLSRNVQTSEVYKYMGLCNYELGDYTNALLNLDKAIILSDEDKSLSSKYNEIKTMLDKK